MVGQLLRAVAALSDRPPSSLSPQQVYEILKRTTCTKAKYSMGEDIARA